MANAGYCNTGYSSSAPKCVLKSPIKSICPRSCDTCGIHFFYTILHFLRQLHQLLFVYTYTSMFYFLLGYLEYPIAGFNRLCSDISYEKIVGLDRCKAAAKMMKKSFGVAKTWNSYPKGCYIYTDNHVYFNHHLTGQSNPLACPICFHPGGKVSYSFFENVKINISEE